MKNVGVDICSVCDSVFPYGTLKAINDEEFDLICGECKGKKIKKEINYNLFIQPALPPKERHKIEDTLKKLGYKLSGGGTMMDMSECDISFYKEIKE